MSRALTETFIRERCFEKGCAAVRHALPQHAGRYVCPLCLAPFGRDALDGRTLTLEHVPPESMGGKGVVLTCKACNHGSGTMFDSQMEKIDRYHGFGSERATKPIPIEIHVDDAIERGELMSKDGKTWEMSPIARRTHPEHSALIQRQFENGGPEKMEIVMRGRMDAPRLASIGWLRAGYLVAFAALGYRYVLQEAFSLVREQFTTRDVVLDWVPVVRDDDIDPSARYMVRLSAPEILRDAFLVVFGQNVVVLPPTNGDESFFARFSEFTNQKFPIGERGEVPWPYEPVFSLDFS